MGVGTTTAELDALEARYLGEPSPRLPWVAFALSLLAPGLGWAYVGRVRVAVALNLLAVALWAGFVVVWSALQFFPTLPISVFALGWLMLVLMLARDAARHARVVGADYVLRDSNHWLVYAAVALFSFHLPLVGLQQVTLGTVWGSVAVHDDAMYPTLLPGDRLLVDRTSYRNHTPGRGDVIVFADPRHDGRLRVARVIGLPGESIALVDGIPFVDDAPFPRAHLAPDAGAALDHITGGFREELEPWVEETRGNRSAVMYTIAEPAVAYWGEPATWELGGSEYFVLNDNRTDLDDSRSFGAVDVEDLVAMPVFVSYSVDDDGSGVLDALPFAIRQVALGASMLRSSPDFRGERCGRRVQPPSARR